MSKRWEQMAQAEKIEDLRKDMKETMATVNLWINQIRQNGEAHNALYNSHKQTSNLASEVAAAVRALEAKLAKIDP